jgi:biotin carboxylase
MSRPSVLLLGADPYELRACELHGIDPVLLCNSSAYDSGRLRLPPRGTLIRVDDVTNPEDCLAALHREGLADRQFDAVQTTWEFSVVTAAVLGRVLGCRSIDPATALHFRDKSLQKARLLAAGVPVTRTVVIDDIYDVSDVPLEFDRAVLKPIAGGGTTSTSLVRERKDLEEASRAAREQKQDNRTFLLEEFVDGDEWMAEGVVFGGEVLFFGLGAYTQPCLDAITGQVPISLRRLDPVHEAQAYQSAEPVVRSAIAALGLRDGVFHMELFCERGTGRIVFSECAARRGGALTQEQVLAKFNVDLGEAAVLCAIGRQPQIDVKVHPNVVGCAGLYGPAGTVVSYPTSDELLGQPNVTYVQMYVPPGASLAPNFSASADMLGAMLLVTESVEMFDARVAHLRQWFGERLAVAEPGLTTGQRWAWQRKHWPERDYRYWLYDGE